MYNRNDRDNNIVTLQRYTESERERDRQIII